MHENRDENSLISSNFLVDSAVDQKVSMIVLVVLFAL